MFSMLSFVSLVFSGFLSLFLNIEVDPGITVLHCIGFVVVIALLFRFLFGRGSGGSYQPPVDIYNAKHAPKPSGYIPRHSASNKNK